MKDSELKARLAQAEVHFSHYRWDDAIATFEAVLAAHPDHPAATQGWANAVEQKNIDEELSQGLAKVRASLAAHRFDDALSVLNHAQTRGALSHILKYHSEIDGLRSEAQEGQAWQRRVIAAGREAEALASRRRFDQALEVLDNTLRPLNGRGWEALGADLASLRDRLWAERDVSERVQFAQSAYERQDYRLATELAAELHEELPEREDVRQLHERARGAWGRVKDQLAAVDEALAQERKDDALALLASLRDGHPHNPDWQAIALRVHMDHGRQEMARGRAVVLDHGFEDAAEAFEHASSAFAATIEIFPGHPTAAGEQAESHALRDAALFASQAVRDRAAYRWEASREGWQASREQLARAVGVRGRDFGEVVAVVDAMLAEAQAALNDLEQARLLLAEGRQALKDRDAGRAREHFRSGLARVEARPWGDTAAVGELRDQLGAGLHEAEQIQKDVRKLLSQAEATRTGGQAGERLKLLRRAYQGWETAPGLAARLADALLEAASANVEAGDQDAALACCEQVRELPGAPVGALSAAGSMSAGIRAQRDGAAAVAAAAARMDAAGGSFPPSPEAYSEALAILEQAAPALEDAKDLAPQFETLRARAEDGRRRALAARPLVAESEASEKSGRWSHSAKALAAAQEALGPLASPEMAERLAELRRRADAVEKALGPATEALQRAEAVYATAADGDLADVDWNSLERAVRQVCSTLRHSAGLPSPLPEAWEETKARAEALRRRSKVLAGVRDKLAAGRGAAAIPILQAEAASDPDPVVVAVLSRLLDETAGDASMLARDWISDAVVALGRGEVPAAEAYLALARSYAPASPDTIPEIRRIERQMAVLAQARSATNEAREYAAKGEMNAALLGFRRALELMSDGEAALPAAARRQLRLVLDAEDDLAPRCQRDEKHAQNLAEASAMVEALLAWDPSEPLVIEFVAPALARWWKLACRTAGLAHVEAQMVLARDDAAVEAGASLVESHPRDRAALNLYQAATARAGERQVARERRRLERARRLAGRGAYDQALAEIGAEPPSWPPAYSFPGDPERMAEAEALADDSRDLLAELQALAALAAQLRPLVEQMRNAGLEGQYREALAARDRAAFIDSRRRAVTLWEEIDALAALVEERQRSHPIPAATPTRAGVEPPEVSLGRMELHTRAAPASHRHEDTGDPGTAGRGPEASATVISAPAFGGTPKSRVAPGEVAPAEVPAQASRAPVASEAPLQPVLPKEEPIESLARIEPPAPFDLEDWLSNVTELSPEDGEPGNES